MRFAAVSLLSLTLASAAFAQLTPGPVVRSGQPFPIIADFNGDGLDDLVQERNVLINNGTSLDQLIDLNLPAYERVMGALDVNGDGRLDLLTMETGVPVPPSYGGGTIGSRAPQYRLYIADEARTYANPITISYGGRPYIADVDNDGKDDFLVMNSIFTPDHRTIAMDVTVMRSRGDGTFDQLPSFRMPPDPQMLVDNRVLSGDLNHDGITDLVFRCPNDLVVLRGLGGGRFAVESRYVPLNSEYGAWSTRLADIDGDNNLDVVMVGFRSIRVLFGDGHANFPRSARTTIRKTHETVLPDWVPTILHLDELNQPRDLAVGHFTRGDRMQIAAGMGEGDLVVFEWQQGALREVSRTPSEYWLLTIRSGNFTRSGLTDLYAMGTFIWGDNMPRPRVFNGTADATAAATAASSPVHRRAAGPRLETETGVSMQMRAECVDLSATRFAFTREAMFGVTRSGDTKIEAVFDPAGIYFRITAPFANGTGVLTPAGGGLYAGVANVETPCGWKDLTVTARME